VSLGCRVGWHGLRLSVSALMSDGPSVSQLFLLQLHAPRGKNIARARARDYTGVLHRSLHGPPQAFSVGRAQIDARLWDVYSLAVIFWVSWTRIMPYTEFKNSFQLMFQVSAAAGARLRRIVCLAGRPVNAVDLRC
jgi:hypothetical protein